MHKVLLIGNPNVGKSTLFNRLTKSNEHTGNFHGVTVDSKHKIINFNDKKLDFVDLPGLYSLNTFTEEEDVAKKEIFSPNVCRIVIVDANTLKRNLYLCLQLKELGLDFKILINNYDYFEKHGCSLDEKKLSEHLGVECKIINAKKIKLNNFSADFFDIKKENNLIKNNYLKKENKLIFENNVYREKTPNLSEKVEDDNKVNSSINNSNNLVYLNNFFNFINKKINIEKNIFLRAIFGDFSGINDKIIEIIKTILPELIKERYSFISKLIVDCVKVKDNYVYGESKLDKILLKPYVMIPIFFATFFASIYLIFFLIGPKISDLLNTTFEYVLINPVMNLLYSITDNIWLLEFFSGGVFSSFSTVLSFLPQVVLLFIFLTALEDSGIIARMCFVFDDLLSKVGLNGKAIYIMLLGLGCNTMATMATKNLNGKNLKIKSAIINPFISCMARLPVFVIVAAAFFGKLSYFVVVGLYLLGLLIAMLLSLILNKTLLKTEAGELLLEFPPIRKIDFRHLLESAKTNAIDFTRRVFGVVVSVGIIVWILTHTALNFTFTQVVTDSMLYLIAEKISFVFTPIGLNNAGIICSLVVGIMAKELIVSILSISNNVASTSALIASLVATTSVIHFNMASAVSFLIFSSLYSPCMSTIAVIKKEAGKFWMWFTLLLEFTVAYLLSFIVYSALTRGVVVSLIVVTVIALIMFAVIFISKKIRSKKCALCLKCRR